ncbi:MAG TPA: oligosaccharide flippase family protein [Chitinophagaceae bacterium]|nr:oligosaccharide flippase family protein [Chitinophagaceae bacterium]
MVLPGFFAKFNNKHFFSLAGNVIMSGLSIVIMGVLYRYLPNKAEMGNWVFFQTIFALVEMFRTGFLTTATIKFYSGASKERSAEIIGSAWVLATGITLTLLLLNIPAVLLTNAINIDRQGGLFFFLKWFGLSYLFSLPSFIANCVLQAEARFDRLLYMRAVNQFSFLVFIIVLIAMHSLTLETLVYVYLLSLLLTSVFVLAKGWTHVWAWKRRTRSGALELYHFGKFSVLGNISSYLLRGSDIIIINFMLGAEAVATYNIGLKLVEVIEIPLRSFVATALPSLSAAYNRGLKKDMIYIMNKYAGLLTIALIPVCVGSVLFADIAVYIINGGMNNQAANVLRFFMTFSLLFPADRFIAVGLDVIHKPNINFLKILVMLAVNVATDFAGIALFGNIYGVAIATVFPLIVGIWIGYWSLRKYEPFTLQQIPAVGYAEMRLLLRDKLNFRKKRLT